MRSFALLAAAAVLLPTALIAQAAPSPATASAKVEKPSVPFVRADAERVVRDLAVELENNFVFPDKAKSYAAKLRERLAAGAYAHFDSADAFAKAVTADLQSVFPDQHLALHPPTAGDDGEVKAARVGALPNPNAISKSGWIADGVAYVRFEMFPENAETLTALRTFLDTHGDAKTLIIDARTHRGGGFAEMDMLFPQLFAKPTVLVDLDTRVAAEEGDGDRAEVPSLRKVDGPAGVVRREHIAIPAEGGARLADAKIFLLTSHRTASAGEHLALALKRTGRATLIGETTHGAGNYGAMVPVGHGYAAFIPFGRTFDPDTGQGWEAVGVTPNIAVPAEQALDEALKMAGVPKSADVAMASLR